MSEQWRRIPGFEYQVSSEGQVRSHRGVLKPSTSADGYKKVILRRDARSHGKRVHRLVLEAFVGPAPAGEEGCHRDGNPANNHLENLRWGSSSANTLDTIRHGRHAQARKTHCPKGHEYSPSNTYIRPSDGTRVCRTCGRLRDHRKKSTD